MTFKTADGKLHRIFCAECGTEHETVADIWPHPADPDPGRPCCSYCAVKVFIRVQGELLNSLGALNMHAALKNVAEMRAAIRLAKGAVDAFTKDIPRRNTIEALVLAVDGFSREGRWPNKDWELVHQERNKPHAV